jgi:thiol-disulfide isomerase/thioredoxin
MAATRKTKKASHGKKNKSITARSVKGRILPPIDITSVDDLAELDKRISIGPITLAFVYADWCGHCNRYKPNMTELESLSNRSVQTVRIRDDIFPKSSINNTKLEGYPSLLLIKPANKSEGKPEAISFEHEDGKVNSVIPDHNNMQNMASIVKNAGTPAGLKIIDKANIVAINKNNGSLIKNISKNNNKNNSANKKTEIVEIEARNKNTSSYIMNTPVIPSSQTTMPFTEVKMNTPVIPSSQTTMPFTEVKINTPSVKADTPSVEVKNSNSSIEQRNSSAFISGTEISNKYDINMNSESANSSERVDKENIVYTPLSISPANPPDLKLDRKTANILVAEKDHVEDASTRLSQEGQKGGLMKMLAHVAYRYGPPAAFLYMEHASKNKVTKKRR